MCQVKMSAITAEQVKHIAKLARLGLKDKEIKKMQNDLAVILDYIELLNQADVSNVKPSRSTAVVKAEELRQDKAEPEKSEVAEKILEQAPDQAGNYFKVKQVL